MALLQKLLKIQSELKAPKNQYNEFGGFSYRSCEDILSAAKPLCVKEGVLLTLSDKVVIVGDRHYVQAAAQITDGEDSIIVSAFARETESRPKMDAAQLTGSASSYARKYALNGLFCLDDTKDADAMKPVEDKPASKPKTQKAPTIKDYLKTVADTAKKQHLEGDDIREIMRSRYKKANSSELTIAEAKDFAENFVDYAVAFIEEQGKLMEGV